MRIKDQLKEQLASDLESKGLTVIRVFKRAQPDLIAFEPKLGTSIQAIKVKPTGEEPTKLEQDAHDELECKGIDVTFRYIEERTSKTTRMMPEEKEAFERGYFKMGYQAYQDGAERSTWPRHPEKYRSMWYVQKNGWLAGWDEAKRQDKGEL